MGDVVTDSRHNEGGGTADGEGGARPQRLPRWTRHETLVLICGKNAAESRARHVGYSAAAADEPKWAAVSSYCRWRGVNRSPMQCRKRWSNLAGHYKKIKRWECGGRREESFWIMSNEQRRERKLPGFFDRELYDVLDSVAEAVFDGGRTAGEYGLFSDANHAEGEREEEEEERLATAPGLATPVPGTANGKQPSENREKGSASSPEPEAQKRRRRRRRPPEIAGENHLESRLLDALQRNSTALAAHLEAQNVERQLEREQRRGRAESLADVLGRLADALGRIADKLPLSGGEGVTRHEAI